MCRGLSVHSVYIEFVLAVHMVKTIKIRLIQVQSTPITKITILNLTIFEKMAKNLLCMIIESECTHIISRFSI